MSIEAEMQELVGHIVEFPEPGGASALRMFVAMIPAPVGVFEAIDGKREYIGLRDSLGAWYMLIYAKAARG